MICRSPDETTLTSAPCACAVRTNGAKAGSTVACRFEEGQRLGLESRIVAASAASASRSVIRPAASASSNCRQAPSPPPPERTRTSKVSTSVIVPS